VARAIYDHIGGASPILAETQKQARALENSVSDGDIQARLLLRCAAGIPSAMARRWR